ncbi:hypothetical protein RFI_04495 [Reticulomyxa filosa]|uniref:PIPK domain-containing protein n=1 Tax=Reticulomyxa filosa TaxID=46433 RepID=X6P3B7_RETFI|nr:hypothetical protein RFI_04495 [Reticulomyxa filosa]|eukprot:ETO32623.1 hypothetical protein RFI_04495 [Reticulomyxa filosa]
MYILTYLQKKKKKTTRFQTVQLQEEKKKRNKYAFNVVDVKMECNGNHRTDVQMVAYAPHVFRYLRTEIYKIDDVKYLKAIANHGGLLDEATRCKFSEGRSEFVAFLFFIYFLSALLFFTHSSDYVVKTVTQQEAELLLELLPDLVGHFRNNRDSLLNKYFGLYSIQMYNTQIYFIVLENIFLPDGPHETYDIKGSWVSRHTHHFTGSGKLMKDEDLNKSLRLDWKRSTRLATQVWSPF